MWGRFVAVRKLLLLPVLILGAAHAAAEDLPTPAPDPQSAVIVLDASKSMNETIGATSKMAIVRDALKPTIASEAEKRALGLVAFGNRKTSSCSDTEVIAEAGALKSDTTERILSPIKPVGKAPLGAAITEAAGLSEGSKPFNIVLIADGGDTCEADLCTMAETLNQQAKDLRIHVVGLSGKPDDIQPLTCIAATTGGKFVAATNEAGFKAALSAVFAAIDAPPPAAAAPIAPVAAAVPATSVVPRTSAIPRVAAPPMVPGGKPGETAVLKSGTASPTNTAERIIAIAPAPAKLAVSPAPPKTQPARPVPVSFHALVTEGGAKLQSGLIWRVYSAKAKTDGGFELISTHREAAPTAALLPGEYLVNAAYGLSNLTKKIKVEDEDTLDETFVLNTGGLSLQAILATGEECPEGLVRFDVQSDEQDQFGARHTILADAQPHSVIRLNAGAYHVKSVYGDANANVGVNVTVEPGRITKATIKHTGAKITFRLVQSLGGEAVADTKWRILTSAGDTVKSNAGALPTHILAAGSYAVVAEYGDKTYTRKFSIEPGNDKQIEVSIEDGPTSAEELQALLDPPEAPRPGTGGLAGEGPGGFDGFSKPADPNAPLLNPGVLLRPSR